MKNLIRLSLVLGLWSPLMHANPECGWPARDASLPAWSSAQFYKTWSSPSTDRELAVIEQVMRGNIPDRLRRFYPIRYQTLVQNVPVELELQVTADYLMIGTDDDFVRTPLTNYAAQYIAGELGMVLPTPFLVSLIYDQADVKLIPQPTDWYKHDSWMRLGSNYVVFNDTIEAQRKGRAGLIAGHKKDVVLANILDNLPGRVAIYGWQEPGNKPIQPLAAPHDYFYEDYSHGIRFLGPTVKITNLNDKSFHMVRLVEALQDEELGSILNGGEGKIHDVRAARRCTPQFAQAMGYNVNNCPLQPVLCPRTRLPWSPRSKWITHQPLGDVYGTFIPYK